MNTDCQWIDKNLEAFFSGTLSQEDQHRAQHHIANCGQCGKEVAALNSIDPLVKRYFDSELRRVQQEPPRRIAKVRLAAVSSVALLAACLLFAIALHNSRSDSNASSAVPIQAANSPSQPADTVVSAKTSDREATAERTKPADSTANVTVQAPRAAAAPDSNAPDFMVIDPAGYSRTLSDYRGYVFVLSILNRDQRDVISHFEQLYKQFGSNRKFRFLAVSSDRQIRMPNTTTFPVAYNHGSKLFGALPGDFVLLDETGALRLRGSLVKDFERLQKTLQEK
jgi:hypothetical protein